jgi:uncharacterized membrane protein
MNIKTSKKIELILITLLLIIYVILGYIHPHQITEDGTFISSPFFVIMVIVFSVKGMIHYMTEMYYVAQKLYDWSKKNE